METQKFNPAQPNDLMPMFKLDFKSMKQLTKEKFFFDTYLLEALYLQNRNADIFKTRLNDILQTAKVDALKDGKAIYVKITNLWGEEAALQFFFAARRYDIICAAEKENWLLQHSPDTAKDVIKFNMECQRINKAAFNAGMSHELAELNDWNTLAYFDDAAPLLQHQKFNHMLIFPYSYKCWNALLNSGNSSIVVEKLRKSIAFSQHFLKTKIDDNANFTAGPKDIFQVMDFDSVVCYELIKHLIGNSAENIFAEDENWKILNSYKDCWSGNLLDLITGALVSIAYERDQKGFPLYDELWREILKNDKQSLYKYLTTLNDGFFAQFIYKNAKRCGYEKFVKFYKQNLATTI